jgi:3-deoxy-D-manno-octulosonate 8-phosphate phosphatase, YrbI family
MHTIAFIPLRGGSKSIPLKNIKPIAGKPLALWTVEAAANCAGIDRVFVSTDDDKIRQTVEALLHPKVEVVGRSAESASDTASTESAMLEFASSREFDRIVLIQATSPLLTSADLSAGLAELDRSGADSLLSVVEQKRFIWKRDDNGIATPTNYDFTKRPRRQEFAPYYVENGAFYICSRSDLLKSGCRLSGRVALHVMPEETYYELDEPSDWAVIESLLRQRCPERANFPGLRISPEEFARRAARIKLFLTDVDGVLTDAGMYYSETGDELKKFNTRDGKGIELLRKAGIKTGIITTENTRIVERRAAKLKMDYLVQGAEDKLPELERILAKTGFAPDELAYIGDDLADIPVLERVGLAACPADAIPQVQRVVHFQTESTGGGGAVREFAERILSARASKRALTCHPESAIMAIF